MLDNYQSQSFRRIRQLVSQYDLISFDIFDTLLKRDVPEPTDVFRLMEETTGIKGFRDRRVQAEQEARKRTESSEVTLEEIYDCLKLPRSSGKQKNRPDNLKRSLLQQEKELEIALSTKNRDLYPVFQYCVKEKQVILISDMYLDRETVTAMLNKNGITGYRKLYLSSEVNQTKMSGELFRQAKEEYGGRRRLHIGNAFRADYICARKEGYDAVKIATHYSRMKWFGQSGSRSCSFRSLMLETFINQHICGSDDYERFGYACFGPVLYGFVCWLYENLQRDQAEQVFFLSRDGFIIKQVYDMLGFNQTIPSVYFEASRRSLRVPAFHNGMSYEEVLREFTVPSRTNIRQIFNILGLEAENYSEVIQKAGFDLNSHIERDRLKDNQAFRRLYEKIQTDVFQNADRERENLKAYLAQYDFRKKTALVDIGWGGSMQKYLHQILTVFGIPHQIEGFYLGLTPKARENLGQNHLSARGYVFDRLRDAKEDEPEGPFIGLFETLFLEQAGSVHRYEQRAGGAAAVRYPYEYQTEKGRMREAVCVDKIQRGAQAFVEDYQKSITAAYVGTDPKIMTEQLFRTGTAPGLDDWRLFGDFVFFNNGSEVFLAKPQPLLHYLIHPGELKRDLYDAQWKVGFLKGLLKMRLPYLKMYQWMKKRSS